MMTQKSLNQSDLLDWAEHEHDHMSKLFLDLNETFRMLQSESTQGESRQDIVDQAIEDLDCALEDTLEHFNEEEEVYFVAIESKFPEFADRLEQLIQTHEEICNQIKALKRAIMTIKGARITSEQFASLSQQVQVLVTSMSVHNKQEQDVFHEALARLSTQERQALMETKRSLG